jgi:hypothetical protein
MEHLHKTRHKLIPLQIVILSLMPNFHPHPKAFASPQSTCPSRMVCGSLGRLPVFPSAPELTGWGRAADRARIEVLTISPFGLGEMLPC